VAGFYVENHGCRATQADGAAIERDLQARGLTPLDSPQQADLVVLNTCTVTAAADQDARAAIRRIRRQNPQCRILVTGCYAQRAPEELAALPGVTAVVGNSHKPRLGEIACSWDATSPANGRQPESSQSPPPDSGRPAALFVSDIFAHTELLGAPIFGNGARTRPNLKVQDGCNNRCSFCIIPAVRGRSRSLSLDEAVSEVQALAGAGYREVVLSGINLGRWGRDLPGRLRFPDLVRAILERTALEKLRLSSVEPMDWSDDLIALMAGSSRLARHAHVPLQSGSDRMLRAMFRKYRPWHYAERIRKIRQAMPDAAIGADVMVGFPGETDGDFDETRRLIAQLPLTYLHVFTYSPRPGTRAAEAAPQVPAPVMRQRNRILRELAAEKKLAFMNSFLGRTLAAITLNVYENGRTEALTDNYLKLRLPGRHAANQWLTALVERAEPEGLLGTPVAWP
jgi:threonylcarbamoyladenosine tRNA methylthiotransferase MtaB